VQVMLFGGGGRRQQRHRGGGSAEIGDVDYGTLKEARSCYLSVIDYCYYCYYMYI
jgi:hypothetical protein